MIFTYFPVPNFTIFTLPLILSILSVISLLFVILTYSKFIRLRLKSRKLILQITICESIIQLLTTFSLFYTVYPPNNGRNPPTYTKTNGPKLNFYQDGFECQFLGMITTFFIMNYTAYNFFNIHNLYSMTFANINTFDKRFKIYIIVSNILSLSICIIGIITNSIENTALGFCAITSNGYFMIIEYINLLCYMISFFVIFKIWSYNKNIDKFNINESSFERKSRHECVKEDLIYIFTFIIIWLPYNITKIYASSCNANPDEYCEEIRDLLVIISFNLLTTCSLGMVFAKINISIVKHTIYKYICGIKKGESSDNLIEEYNSKTISINNEKTNEQFIETINEISSDSNTEVDNSKNLLKEKLISDTDTDTCDIVKINSKLTSHSKKRYSFRPKLNKIKSLPLALSSTLDNKSQVDNVDLTTFEGSKTTKMALDAENNNLTAKRYHLTPPKLYKSSTEKIEKSRSSKMIKLASAVLNKTELLNILISINYFCLKNLCIKNDEENDIITPGNTTTATPNNNNNNHDWDNHYYIKVDIEIIKPQEELNKYNETNNNEIINLITNNLKDEEIHKEINCIQYAKEAFNHIIKLWEINQTDILKSMNLYPNIEQLSKISCSKYQRFGKDIVYTTYNKVFLFKLIDKDRKFFITKHFLQPYHAYCIQNPITLLPRLCGLYTFGMPNNKTINILLLQNRLNIKLKPLKRITLFSATFIEEDFNDNGKLIKVSKKIVLDSEIKVLKFKEEDRSKLIDNLRKDVRFLAKCKMCNYKIGFYIFDNTNINTTKHPEEHKENPIDTQHELDKNYIINNYYELQDNQRAYVLIEICGNEKQDCRNMQENKNFGLNDPNNYQIMMEEYIDQYL